MTRRELEATFSAGKAAQDGLLSSRFYRRISFLVTPWFMNAGVSANAVTGMAILCSLAMPAAAVLLGPQAWAGVALLIFVYLVLDCVDGNIARFLGASGPVGQYLDSIAGKIYAVSRTLALGIIAGHEWPRVGTYTWLSLALFAALLFIWGRESRQYYKITTGSSTEPLVGSSARLKDAALAFTEVIPFFLLLLGPLERVWLVFVALFLFYAALFAWSQVRILRELSRS